jgi:hypothetical protein
MHQIKNFIPVLALLLMFACIKPFDPRIGSNAENKFVVSGRVTDLEGWQQVNVSMSTPIENPEYIPVSGCQVNILDNQGNVFPLVENKPGNYRVWIGKEYLNRGTSYKVTVFTPESETIESSFDTLMQGAPLDSVYYIIEDVPTSNPSIYLSGMQFYVDLNAPDVETRNYKWEVEESWEHHAAHPAEYYYDGGFHQIMPPDSSNMVCWVNGLLVKNVYTLSTKSLSQNVFYKYPLQFVDGHTSRLGILYSILVRQLALSESAYYYWEQVRINSSELGGLYEIQPFAIKGNLINLTNPEKEVLGHFYAASESSKRYFYKDIEGLELDFSYYCNEEPLGRFGWREFNKNDYPVYYYFNSNDALRILNNECVDCRLMGGTTTKPDFWPQ